MHDEVMITLTGYGRATMAQAREYGEVLYNGVGRLKQQHRDAMLAFGRLLCEVRSQAPHGTWKSWLRMTGWKYRTACMCMQTWRNVSEPDGSVDLEKHGLGEESGWNDVRLAAGTQTPERVRAHTPDVGESQRCTERAPLDEAARLQLVRYDLLTMDQQFEVMCGTLEVDDCFDEHGNHLPEVGPQSLPRSSAPPAVGVVEATGPAAPTAIPCAESVGGERDSRQRHEQLTLDEIYQRADEVRAAIAVLMQRHERGEIADATERLERMLEIAAA